MFMLCYNYLYCYLLFGLVQDCLGYSLIKLAYKLKFNLILD
jgi:hypothetical protein